MTPGEQLAYALGFQTGTEVELKVSDTVVWLRLFADGERVGSFYATGPLDRDEMRMVMENCSPAVARHVREGKPLWAMSVTELAPELRNQGFGRKAYATVLTLVGEQGGLLVPDYCAGGSTSVSARRVWDRVKAHPASGIRNPGFQVRPFPRVDPSPAVTRPGHLYRGMTQAEYRATVGAGKGVRSRQDYSGEGEGTSFATDFGTAESYVDFGRDDPRKTGLPNYVVEVLPGRVIRGDYFSFPEPGVPVLTPDGYVKWPDPGAPSSAVTRVWALAPKGDKVIAVELSSRRAPQRR